MDDDCGAIDLNSDLGEGFGVWTLGDDLALLEIVTSANVACGFHAGDPSIMALICARAAERDVAVGAQVGYRDLAGFGRRAMDIEPEPLSADVLYQIGALEAFCRSARTRVRYVKPHGALYNRCAVDEVQAGAVVSAVHRYDPRLPVMGLPGSALFAAADELGQPTIAEAFADRAYTPTGSLVSRGESGAVIHDVEAISRRSVEMVVQRRVVAVDGSHVPLQPQSLCVHGDTPGAVEIARAVRDALQQAGIRVAPAAP